MTISRLTLPAEFYDRTSEIVLKQPEPEYFWARLLYMADAQAQLRRAEALGVPWRQGGGVGTTGASVPDLESMQLILNDTIRGEGIIVSDELAKGKVGHTIRMNRPRFTDSTYTFASRIVGSNSSVSTTPIDISAEQVSITIYRAMGPYGSSQVQPYGIDRFDAEHSVHSTAQHVGLQLQRDRTKVADTMIRDRYFVTSPNLIVFPGDSTFSITTDANAFPANTPGFRKMSAEVVYRAEQKLQDQGIPRFANGNYMLVCTPKQIQELRNNPQFRADAVFDKERNPLANSYVGTIGRVEVYMSATNPTDSSTVAGITIQKAIMFGPGMVGYASAGPVRVEPSSDDNYGETAKVVWICYEGHETLDKRFGVEIHSN